MIICSMEDLAEFWGHLPPQDLAIAQVQAGNNAGRRPDKNFRPSRRKLGVLHLPHMLQQPVNLPQLRLLDERSSRRQGCRDQERCGQRECHATSQARRWHAVACDVPI